MMKMRNGKYFSTGNHPVEMLVPMLHMEKAGLSIDVVTPSGKPVKIETWALPRDDEKVMDIYDRYKSKFKDPGSFSEVLQDNNENLSRYRALFIPGGHGAMLGLPESPELGKIIYWMVKNDKFLLSICHGPAAFLSASIGREESPFKGYSLVAWRGTEKVRL